MLPVTVSATTAVPNVASSAVTSALNISSKCAGERRSRRYCVNAYSWHSPNVPRACTHEIVLTIMVVFTKLTQF